ncbi:MAG: hypothetical protein R2734_15700 [Nocardioides sp.]
MSGSDPGDLRPLAGEGRSTGRRWPRPQLVAPSTEPPAPAVAGIDAHNHLGRWLSADGSFVGGPLDELVELMAGAQLTTVVNLDGRWGEELEENLERYDRRDPRRVVTFCHLDWRLLQLGDAASPECQRVLAEQLADSARRGARGVKVWKDLGLGVRDASGALVLPDDPRVVGVLRVAGELGLPVLIHGRPGGLLRAAGCRQRAARQADRDAVVVVQRSGLPHLRATPGGPACARRRLPRDDVRRSSRRGMRPRRGGRGARDPAQLPVDTSGRLRRARLGRQPRRFQALVEPRPECCSRTACSWTPAAVRRWWRFLETADEHFDYGEPGRPPEQGNWRISGAALPRTLLPALYRDNAARCSASEGAGGRGSAKAESASPRHAGANARAVGGLDLQPGGQ